MCLYYYYFSPFLSIGSTKLLQVASLLPLYSSDTQCPQHHQPATHLPGSVRTTQPAEGWAGVIRSVRSVVSDHSRSAAPHTLPVSLCTALPAVGKTHIMSNWCQLTSHQTGVIHRCHHTSCQTGVGLHDIKLMLSYIMSNWSSDS